MKSVLRWRATGWFLFGWLLAARAFAADVYVPDQLQPWVDWVLAGEEQRRCPLLTGTAPEGRAARICGWPGRLTLTADADGAEFSQAWDVVQRTWIALPGDRNYWPRDVRLDGNAASVGERNDAPVVELMPGRHRISGRFNWTRRPAQLAVPASTGLVSLVVDGNAIERPSRDEQFLWLGERRDVQEEQRLDLRVYRRLEDGIPFLAETRVRLDVGGPAREEVLPNAVPEGFAGMMLQSELPARVEPDGRLRLQVRPGSWEVTIASRAQVIPETITARPMGPGEEVWSYQSTNRLRVTALEQADSVDPAQSGVPDDWQSLPAFRVPRDQMLRIAVRDAGARLEEANQLTLRRDIWLDFAGDGFTARDLISGQMKQGWRLDMQAPFRMASARIDEQNLLVTQGGAEDLTGVELRQPQLNLEVVARLPQGATRAAATGYAQRLGEVSALLHLPPAHRLLWARGADRAPESWVNRWNLLDLFLLLLIAVGTGRLVNPLAGGIAFAALLLTYQDPGAPVWSWLNVLAAVAIASVAPEGRLRRAALVYRAVSLLALLAILVPFVVTQARLVIHPQLEPHWPAAGRAAAPAVMQDMPVAVDSQMIAEPGGAMMAEEVRSALPKGAPREIVVTARKREEIITEQLPADAPLQTGPGIPAWEWHRYELGWSGPVEPDEELDLWILGPATVATVRILGIGLTVTLLYLLVSGSYPFPWRRLLRPGNAAAAIVTAVVMAAMPTTSEAASTPDSALLEELKRRLLKAPECAPACALLEHAAVRAEGERLTARLTYHAQAAVAAPVPGARDGWEPDTLISGGAAASTGEGGESGGPEPSAFRDANGQLWVRLAPGVQIVTISGKLTGLDTVSVPFAMPPRSIQATASGWIVAGVTEGRLSSGALELARIRQAPGAAASNGGTTRFPAFAEVARNLALGLDFSVSTRVRRLAPAREAFTLQVDLLPGESVITQGFEVRDGRITAAFAPDQDEVWWQSALPRAETLMLSAGEDRPWRERWTVGTSPVWHLRHEGVRPVLPESVEAGGIPEFWPRPGEQLTLSVIRPPAVTGATLAMDSVMLEVNAGKRSRDVTLAFPYRSTRGGQHQLQLPPAAELRALTVDGAAIPVQPREGVLDLPVLPGRHEVSIEWRESGDITAWQRTAAVDLGTHAANVTAQIALPEDRWILFAAGPGIGPAILYWSELAVFIVVAVLLGRTGWTPLATHEWLLLGLGFSTFSWALLLLVASWFFVMHWRGKTSLQYAASEHWRFNALQVLLGLLTALAIGALISGIPQALLGQPDMHVVGEGSYGSRLQWFVDQAPGPIPQAGTFTVHIWWYKAAMLAWALWITLAFTRWLPWAWQNFSRDGLWRGKVVRPPS